MPAISPKLGELLIKATQADDIDCAFEKIFKEYIDLKLKDLSIKIKEFENKWGMDFKTFKEQFKQGTLYKNTYSFEVEQDFWEWEEAETLKNHYETLKKEWI